MKRSGEVGSRQGLNNAKTLKLESACFVSKVERPVRLGLGDPGR